MKRSNAEAWVSRAQPLLSYTSNRLEFRQRLQWLSEGMLHEHIEPRIKHHPLVAQREVEDYQMFKTLREYEKEKEKELK